MTQDDHAQPMMSEDDIRTLQRLLAEQTREIEALSKELIASYQKELIFFDNLEHRDRQMKEAQDQSLKKIWWLESQWRAQAEELASARAELESVRAQRDALMGSMAGRAQRAYWSARKRILRRGRA